MPLRGRTRRCCRGRTLSTSWRRIRYRWLGCINTSVTWSSWRRKSKVLRSECDGNVRRGKRCGSYAGRIEFCIFWPKSSTRSSIWHGYTGTVTPWKTGWGRGLGGCDNLEELPVNFDALGPYDCGSGGFLHRIVEPYIWVISSGKDSCMSRFSM